MPFWNKHIELSGGAAQVFWPCTGLISKYLMRPTFQVTDCSCRHFKGDPIHLDLANKSKAARAIKDKRVLK